MPDFCKCRDDACPKRENCFRFKAIESPRQAFFETSPRVGSDVCRRYMAIDPNWHLSDCAKNNAPAEPPGDCTCDAGAVG